MKLSKKEQAEFNRITSELMNFLDKTFHPHCTVVVTSENAELLEGSLSNNNPKYQQAG